MSILYIVATPIGNMEDVTFRAIRVLKEVSLIACEDTRHTRKLLDHYGIQTPLVSYHEHNEAARTEQLLEKIAAGADIALVSDAGTPLVSDPGYRVVAAAVEAGVPVVPIPGPSAILAALTGSGLPTDAFRFGGFLPPKAGQRRKVLESVRGDEGVLAFYEAPHRILETLEDVETVLGNRHVVVARELTKLHEEFLRGPVSDVRRQLAARPSVKGEITLLIAKASEESTVTDQPVEEAVRELEAQGVPRMDAIKQVAKARGLGKRDVYKLLVP